MTTLLLAFVSETSGTVIKDVEFTDDIIFVEGEIINPGKITYRFNDTEEHQLRITIGVYGYTYFSADGYFKNSYSVLYNRTLLRNYSLMTTIVKESAEVNTVRIISEGLGTITRCSYNITIERLIVLDTFQGIDLTASVEGYLTTIIGVGTIYGINRIVRRNDRTNKRFKK